MKSGIELDMALSMQEKNSEYYFGGWRRSICICSALNDLPEWAADWVVGESEKDSPPTSMKGNGLHTVNVDVDVDGIVATYSKFPTASPSVPSR